MISAWTKHLKTDEDKERFKRTVLSSKATLERLQELLNEKRVEVETEELSTTVYDSPNWDYRQADINGYKRCLKQITRIINLDQQDK